MKNNTRLQNYTNQQHMHPVKNILIKSNCK